MTFILGLAIGLIIGGCVGFLFACVVMVAGERSAKWRDQGVELP